MGYECWKCCIRGIIINDRIEVRMIINIIYKIYVLED